MLLESQHKVLMPFKWMPGKSVSIVLHRKLTGSIEFCNLFFPYQRKMFANGCCCKKFYFKPRKSCCSEKTSSYWLSRVLVIGQPLPVATGSQTLTPRPHFRRHKLCYRVFTKSVCDRERQAISKNRYFQPSNIENSSPGRKAEVVTETVSVFMFQFDSFKSVFSYKSQQAKKISFHYDFNF